MVLLAMAAAAHAQTFSQWTELYSPLDAVGTPADTYALSGIEWVNYLNGNLVVQVPLGTARGRGNASFTPSVPLITGSWSVAYLSNGSSGSYVPGSDISNVFSGWDYTGGFIQVATVSANTNLCLITSQNEWVRLGPYVTKIIWTTSNQTQITFVDSAYNGEPEESATTPSCSQLNSGYQGVNRGQVFRSTDGSNLTFVASQDIYDLPLGQGVTGTLYFPDGTHYIWTNPSLPPEIEDRNGNTLTYSFTSTQYGGYFTVANVTNQSPKFTFTETPASQSYDTLTFPGYNSATRTVQVNYTLLQNALSTGSVDTYASLFPELNGSSSTQFNPYVVSSIELPDSTTYSFLYDPYGEVTKITLPTGGVYEYSYGAGCTTAVSPNTCYSDGVIKLPNQASTNQEYVIYRRVTQRNVLLSGSTISETLFSAAPSGNIDPNNPNTAGTTVTVTFENGSGTPIKKETHLYYGDPSQQYQIATYNSNGLYPAWVEGLEFQSNVYNPSGSLMQEQQKVFGQRPWGSPDNTSYEWFPIGSGDLTSPSHDPQLCQTNVTNDASQVSGAVLGYDAYNNVNMKLEYDYGNAPSITASCPATSSMTNAKRVTEATYSETGSYIAPAVNLVRLPTLSEVFDPSISTTNPISIDKWGYDKTAVTSATGLLAHDDGNYGTTNNIRGNLSQHQSWWSIPNSYISESFTFDMAGAALSYTDFNGNATNYTFADNAHVSPTKIVNALGATNGTTTLVYDQGNLKPTTATDPNSINTTFTYSDPFDRLTQTVRGSGASQTNYSYPSPTQTTVKQDQVSAGDGAIRVDTLYDGLGRSIQTNQYETTSSYIATTTTYDALGRVSATTNPSRSGDGLNFSTAYTYDALSRLLSATTADGSASSASYSGNTTTATDAAGHARTSTFDALGRLTQVVEDPGSSPHLNYTTTYTNDVLNNLKGVTQSSQTRTYAFDSLSRLTSAVNPESGTTSYTYDNNGNLATQTDARGRIVCFGSLSGSTCTSAVGTGYDAINRPLKKTYSDSTPTVTFTYDTATLGKGYLASVANSVSTTAFSAYDHFGNVLGSSQTTNGTPYSFSYTYNLASDLVTETYPSGRVVTTGYDPANRPITVSGLYNSTTTPYLTSSASQYAPHGAMWQYKLANNVWRQTAFNSQLQPCYLLDTVDQYQTINEDGMNYTTCPSAPSGNSVSQQLLSLSLSLGTSANNGNLLGINYTANALGLYAPVSVAQTYGYDNVNRLTTSSETAAGSTSWSRNLGYDAYSNMWVTSNTGVSLSGLTPTSNVFSSNRASTNTYDAAGNVTALGSSNSTALYYDAENRQTQATEPPSLGGATEYYYYDGFGERVEKSGPAGTITFAYDTFGLLAAEYNTTSNPAPCATCYLSPDHLGTPRMVTDGSANVIGWHDYLPFGEEIPGGIGGRTNFWGATNDNINQKFTGIERDSETGLDFFQSRYFSAAQGRFGGGDPGQAGADATNPQSWNGYAYTINSPLVFTDPNGMDPFDGGDGDDCIDDASLCNPGWGAPGWPAQPIPPPPPPLPPIVSSSGVPNTTGVYGQGQFGIGGGVFGQGQTGPWVFSFEDPNDPYANADVEIGMPGVFTQNVQLWKSTRNVGNALAVGTLAASVVPIAAAEVAALPTMQFAVGRGALATSPVHVAFKAGGDWMNANGQRLFAMRYERGAWLFARQAWFRFSLPILNPKAVQALEGGKSWSCVTGAIRAFFTGWFGGC
jgi:RHS repeat-associated protein